MPSLINLAGEVCPPAASLSLRAAGLGIWAALGSSLHLQVLFIYYLLFLWLLQYFMVARGRSAVLVPAVRAWLSAEGQPLLRLQITHLEKEGGWTGMALSLNLYLFICLESVLKTKAN